MGRRFMLKQSEEKKEKAVYVDANMQGEISFNDPIDLHTNGKFEGKLNTKRTLVIGKQAEIVAEIFGEHITIAATVKGNIKSSKIPPHFGGTNFFGRIQALLCRSDTFKLFPYAQTIIASQGTVRLGTS